VHLKSGLGQKARAEHNYLSDHYLPLLFNLFFLCLLFPSKQTEAVPKFQLHFSDVCAVGWEVGELSAEESRLGMAADVPNSYSFSFLSPRFSRKE